MEELRRLVETAGGDVVQEFSQQRDRKDPGTLIGIVVGFAAIFIQISTEC